MLYGEKAMLLVATMCSKPNQAIDILKEIPNNAVVLFPENVEVSPNMVRYYSKKKNLFVIFNQDYYSYITMRGVDCGTETWQVQKYYLSKGDMKWGWKQAPELSPIITIRGRKTCVAICYEIAYIAFCNKLGTIGRLAKTNNVEIIIMPANWSYNWALPQYISTIAFKKIPSLKASLFSTTRELAFASMKKERKKIVKRGWVSIEI